MAILRAISGGAPDGSSRAISARIAAITNKVRANPRAFNRASTVIVYPLRIYVKAKDPDGKRTIRCPAPWKG